MVNNILMYTKFLRKVTNFFSYLQQLIICFITLFCAKIVHHSIYQALRHIPKDSFYVSHTFDLPHKRNLTKPFFAKNLHKRNKNCNFAIEKPKDTIMLPRRAAILKMLETQNEVFVNELAQSLQTSQVTIRKDLAVLHNKHLLIRTHGGAIRRPVENLNEDAAISAKRLLHYQTKERIGKLAANLIQEGDNIMLDSGTTTMEIARNLDKFSHLTILTNAMNIAVELMRYQRFNVIILGGHVRINSHSTVGPLALSTLQHFSNYKLFLGVDSFSLTAGISTPNLEEALLNQAMIASAGQTIAVFDSSKINKQSFAFIAQPEQINTIISDKNMPQTIQEELTNRGVHILLA